MTELATIVATFIGQFGGVAGLSLALCVYLLAVVQKKLDKLVDINTKMFGAMVILSKKNITDKENQE